MPVCGPFARTGTKNNTYRRDGTYAVHILFILAVVVVVAMWRHAPSHAAVILALPAIAAGQGVWKELMSTAPCTPDAINLFKVFICYFPAAAWLGMWALVRLIV